MSTEIDSLYWKANINYDQLKTDSAGIKNEFKDLSATGEREFGKIEGMVKRIGERIAIYFAFEKLFEFAKGVEEVTSKFQKFEAQLTNILGSKSEAKDNFEMIEQFCKDNGQQVDTVTQSYINLANRGIKPTRDVLQGFADVAASSGHTMNELLDAVGNAEMGAFKGMRQFGIQMKTDGDNLDVTYRGVTTVIANTGDAIQDYVLGLGNLTGVQGAAISMAKTLGGETQNLSNAWEGLLNTIGTKGSDIFSLAIHGLTSFVESMRTLFGGNEYANKVNDIAELANKQREQADTAQELLKRYQDLTENGIKPTADQKKELTGIMTVLKDMFGDNVLAIDNETGSYKLNTSEVNKNIQAKLNAADAEKIELANHIKTANDLAVAKKAQLDAVNSQLGDYNNVSQSQYGVKLGSEKVFGLWNNTTQQGDTYNLTPDQKAGLNVLTSQFKVKVEQLTNVEDAYKVAADKVAAAMEAFKKAGYTESDYFDLYRSGSVTGLPEDKTTKTKTKPTVDTKEHDKLQDQANKDAASWWNWLGDEQDKYNKYYKDILDSVKGFDEQRLDIENKYQAKYEELVKNGDDTPTHLANLKADKQAELDVITEAQDKTLKSYDWLYKSIEDLGKQATEAALQMAKDVASKLQSGVSPADLGLTQEQVEALKKRISDLKNHLTDLNKTVIQDWKNWGDSIKEVTSGLQGIADATGSSLVGNLAKASSNIGSMVDGFTKMQEVQDKVKAGTESQAQAAVSIAGIILTLITKLYELEQQLFSTAPQKTQWEVLAEDMKAYNDQIQRNVELMKVSNGDDRTKLNSQNITLNNSAIDKTLNQYGIKNVSSANSVGDITASANAALQARIALDQKNMLAIQSQIDDENSKSIFRKDAGKVFQLSSDLISKAKDIKAAQAALDDLTKALALKKEYDTIAQKDPITIDQQNISAHLASVKKGSKEELDLKKQNLDDQAKLDEIAELQSEDSEEVRAAKIKAIYAKSIADKEELDKEYIDNFNQTTFGQTADTLTKAIEQGFNNGETFAQAFSDNINSMLKNAILNSFDVKYIEPEIDKLMADMDKDIAAPGQEWHDAMDAYETAKDKYNKDKTDASKKAMDDAWNSWVQEGVKEAQSGGLTPDEISALQKEAANIGSSLDDKEKLIQSILDGLSTNTTSTTKIGLTGSAQQMTEDTANLLAGQMGNVVVNIAQQTAIATQGLAQLNLIQKNTFTLYEIRDILKTNGSLRANGL